MKDYSFNLYFYVDSEEHKALEKVYYDKERYPLMFGPIIIGYFSIITIETDFISGISTFSFVPVK
jgi:hypothetical protein